MKILLKKLLYRVYGIGMFLFIVVAFANAAQVLWYNGDWNSGMYSNLYYSSPGSCIIYDDFEVTDTNGWVIETVWSNVALRIESEVTLAFWEIRSGISAGNGGTLLYSGINTVAKEATGRVLFSDPEYSLKVTDLNVFLPQGRYWLAVAPVWDDVTGGNFTALVGTDGSNAVGSPAGNNKNSFWNWPGKYFEATPVFPHDFSMGVEGSIIIPDIAAPSVINDLKIINITHATIDLTWTAPGDDGSTGMASQYDIRYSSIGVITDVNWDSATQIIGEPAPAIAGTTQNMTVSNLINGTTYYFAMKTADEVPNWSGLSNVATTSPDAKNAVVYPNPYIKGKSTGERISFSNLPEEATIRIYTISGKLIKTIKHKETADGGSGEWDISGISSGIYLYTIISSEGKKTGKVSVIK